LTYKFVIAYPFGGRPVPVDWHLAVRSLLLPSNVNVREICRRSYVKDGEYTIPIDKAQTEMAEEALSLGAQYILFIEDDTIPPPGVLLELSRILETSDESIMVCGGIYTTRSNPPEPIVYMGPSEGCFWNWKLGEIFPCWACGMGCTMIRTEIFKLMPKPWFRELKTIEEVREYPDLFPVPAELVPSKKGGVSSDMFFYAKLAQMGFQALAHGGVLPIHWDIEKNTGYWLPKDSPPIRGVKFNGKEFGWTDPTLQIA
jgi:hypothetical protein